MKQDLCFVVVATLLAISLSAVLSPDRKQKIQDQKAKQNYEKPDKSQIFWKNDYFKSVNGFQDETNVIQSAQPEVKGAIITRVRVQNNTGFSTYTINSTNATTRFEVLVKSNLGGKPQAKNLKKSEGMTSFLSVTKSQTASFTQKQKNNSSIIQRIQTSVLPVPLSQKQKNNNSIIQIIQTIKPSSTSFVQKQKNNNSIIQIVQTTAVPVQKQINNRSNIQVQTPAAPSQKQKNNNSMIQIVQTVGIPNPPSFSEKQKNNGSPIQIVQTSAEIQTPPLTPPTSLNSSQSSSKISTLNGALNSGNYIWSGAMNLAWNELLDDFNDGKPLSVSVNNSLGKQEVANFNARPFSAKDLSSDSYYVQSGYGKQTLDKINSQVKQKFPQKTFNDVKLPLGSKDIISYAYFAKDIQYLSKFDKKSSEFSFQQSNNKTKKVEAFEAVTSQQRSNIQIVKYSNDDDFILKLKLKQPNQEMYLIKGSNDKTPEQIISMVTGPSQRSRVSSKDKFEMPIVDFNIDRQYSEIIGSKIQAGNLKNYIFKAMLQKIKFKIDQVGAKVENLSSIQGVGSSLGGRTSGGKKLIFNKPFWIVMRQKGAHPYFIAQINNANFMKSS